MAHLKMIDWRYGKIVINPLDTHIGKSVQYYGEYSQKEANLLQAICRGGDNVLNIGANIGCHTFALSKIVGKKGSVISFEPQRELYDMLDESVSLNRFKNISYYNWACSDHEGILYLPEIDYETEDNFGGYAATFKGRTPVQCKTIDDLFIFHSLRLMKIDVEGGELNVLKGADKTILTHRPILYVENEKPKKTELKDWITDLGYRIFWHSPPMFNPDNFNKQQDNIFEGMHSFNLFCLPNEMPSPNMFQKELREMARS